MSKIKKPFSETILGKIVAKAGGLITDVPGIIAKVAMGNPLGAISDVMSILSRGKTAESQELFTEIALKMKSIELEFDKVDLEESRAILHDIQDARANRKDSDWMFNVVVAFGLFIIAFIIYAITYVTIPSDNRDLFIHLVGIVEGAVFLKIFTFFLGSSKGSRDKNNIFRIK